MSDPGRDTAPGSETAATDAAGTGPPQSDDEHDRRRRRTGHRILLVGAVLSILLVLVGGLLGVPGQLAGALFVSLLSLTAGVAGATVAIGVVVDQLRGRRVSGRRVLLTGVLLLVTLLLLIASAGSFLDAVDGLA